MLCIFNWSGGKDSALALFKAKTELKLDVRYLLTSISSKYQRISMHGVRRKLLEEQAKSIGIDLKTLSMKENADMDYYNQHMLETMSSVKREGIDYALFGDIFLEDLRQYREKQLERVQMKALFPLWQRNTNELAREFINLGFKTIITTVDASKLDSSFVGRLYDESFLGDLPSNVDPCGENGEFHSFAFDGPIFSYPINFKIGEKVLKTYPSNLSHDGKENSFWYIDLIHC